MKLLITTVFVSLFTVLVFFTPLGSNIKDRFVTQRQEVRDSKTGSTQRSVPQNKYNIFENTKQEENRGFATQTTESSAKPETHKQNSVEIHAPNPSSLGITLPFTNTRFRNPEELKEHISKQLDAAKETGASMVRVGVPWSFIEPKKPERENDGEWWLLDVWVEEAKKRKLDILLRLDAVRKRDCEMEGAHWPGVPFECSKNEADLMKQTALPKNIAAWQNFVRTVARRYGYYIRYFQVGNEVNIEETWFGSPEDYLILLRKTKEALYEVDPKLELLTAGMTGSTLSMKELSDKGTLCNALKPTSTQCLNRKWRVSFIDYVLRNGRMIHGESPTKPKQYGFDIADIHIYENIGSLEAELKIWKQWLKETTPQEVSAPKFWITETGGPYAAPTSSKVSYEEFISSSEYKKLQTREVIGRLFLLKELGAERMFWWSLIDASDPGFNPRFKHMGLYSKDYKVKESGKLFAFLASHIDSVERLTNTPSGITGVKANLKLPYRGSGVDKLLIFFTKDERGIGSRDVVVHDFGEKQILEIGTNGDIKRKMNTLNPNTFLVDETPLVLMVSDTASISF